MPTYNTDFNWSSGSLPANVTSGGGANGTVWNSSGLLASGSAGRITYDPMTLTCLGIWLEAAATNYMGFSESFNSSGWTVDAVTLSTSGTSPDGTSDAILFTGNATNAVAHGIYNSYVTTSASPTFSLFGKAGTAANVYMAVGTGFGVYAAILANISSTPAMGVTQIGQFGGQLNSKATRLYPNAWTRPWLNVTMGNASGGGQFGMADNDTTWVEASGYGDCQSNGGNTISSWGAQFENNNFPTSPIITPTTSSVTRSADTATSTNATYIAQRGFLVTARTPEGLPPSGSTQIVWQLDDTTNNNACTIYRDTSGNIHLRVLSGGTQQCDLNSGVTVGNYSDFKVAIRLAASNFGISVNGSTPVTQSTGSMPTPTTGRFGYDTNNSNYWFGTLARVQGATTLSNSELQNESSLQDILMGQICL